MLKKKLAKLEERLDSYKLRITELEKRDKALTYLAYYGSGVYAQFDRELLMGRGIRYYLCAEIVINNELRKFKVETGLTYSPSNCTVEVLYDAADHIIFTVKELGNRAFMIDRREGALVNCPDALLSNLKSKGGKKDNDKTGN